MRSFMDELGMLKQQLGEIVKAFEGVKITYKLGNHEERLDTYLCQKAPELFGLPELQLENLLGLQSLGIDIVKNKRVIKLGHLSVIHGHELKGGMVSPVSPARTFVLRTKTNVIGGHHHQTSEQNDRKLNGDLLSGFSTGCLCNLYADYMSVNNWNHGAAIVEMDGDDFFVRSRRILNGRTLMTTKSSSRKSRALNLTSTGEPTTCTACLLRLSAPVASPIMEHLNRRGKNE
jgi:hypothetical protein